MSPIDVFFRLLLIFGFSKDASPSLLTITIDEISRGLDGNKFTSVDLVRAYLERIKEVNDDIHAVLEINPDAVTIAHQLDKERKQNGRRGPLHGVPILLKDNIYTNDRTETTAGSYAFLGARKAQEGTIITRLREAGAVILGKTNLSEWANFRSTNATGGWSARGGQTFGAFAEKQSSGGSSSGSAVAMSLGLATVSLGTDTDGSISYPAQRSSVVGIRATTGLTPRDGVIPLSDRQDSVGPMTRTVKDAAYLLTAIAGPSKYDNATSSIPFDKIPNYVESCQGKGTKLRGIRLGVPYVSDDPYIAKSFKSALKTLSKAGVTIVHGVKYRSEEEWDAWDESERKKPMDAEFQSSIRRWCSELTENPQNITSVDDIIEFTKETKEEEFPQRNIERFLGAQKSPGIDAPETQVALKKMLRCCGEDGILGALKDYKLDGLVFPNTPSRTSTFAARIGLPIVAVPLGFYPKGTQTRQTDWGNLTDVAANVPYGIAFTGPHFSESTLLRVACAFESKWTLHPPKLYIAPRTELKHVRHNSSYSGEL
ncbi:glutamyl-tRNA amidotransferase subunit A [Rostrohypoxylon terebratum]|nr:glutamyl-tRNA amidotransferase subunit A [Rostrohypoxylon terebratum]